MRDSFYRDLAVPHYKRSLPECCSASGFPNFRWINDDAELNINFEPGSRFAYSGEGIELLQLVVETITNKPLQELMQAHVFQPLGMSSCKGLLVMVSTTNCNNSMPSPEYAYREPGSKLILSFLSSLIQRKLGNPLVWSEQHSGRDLLIAWIARQVPVEGILRQAAWENTGTPVCPGRVCLLPPTASQSNANVDLLKEAAVITESTVKGKCFLCIAESVGLQVSDFAVIENGNPRSGHFCRLH